MTLLLCTELASDRLVRPDKYFFVRVLRCAGLLFKERLWQRTTSVYLAGETYVLGINRQGVADPVSTSSVRSTVAQCNSASRPRPSALRRLRVGAHSKFI